MPAWKILCVTSESYDSDIIELLLGRLFFLERFVRVIKVSSVDEAASILEKARDIAVILLDIEEDKTKGLMFIHEVRKKYLNHRVRIILRTGYPYILPDKQEIQDYTIDGYIPKEVVAEAQIEITVMTAIRAYHQIISTEVMLSSLAGSIAHEMRNPLSQIHGSLHMLKKQLPQLNDNMHVKGVHQVIKNSLQMIDTTLDAINEKPVNKEKFKIISSQYLVDEALKGYAYSEVSQAEKISYTGGDFKLYVDPVMLKYILYNLIGNALYYVKTLPDAEIIISLLPDTRQIEVRDTGPGIAEKIIPNIFDSFYTCGKQGATGLGLAYCKRSMKALGGDIVCQSKLGVYTAFMLSFPEIPPQKVQKVTAERDLPVSLLTQLRARSEEKNRTGN